MRRAALLLTLLAGLWAAPLAAREAVAASAPSALAVTLYRDPEGGYGELDPDWPEGFAMITETRTVTLPPGESTIRFEGVAEGMIAISAIVTGLPGGTIEKNRNAELLSPASLIDGSLGNRVTVTRTNPATGAAVAEQAVVRTRADGGLVLQTSSGFEAVRCSGLPEKLSFERVPTGLSAQPVFSVDTRDHSGGTYTVELTYLAWGFDWQAHYVATLAEPGRNDEVRLRLMSWLTLLNDNGQSFPDAELLVVAGKLSVVSDFAELGDAPSAPRLQLTCYPLGSTAAGSAIVNVDEALLENSSTAALESNLNRLPQFAPDAEAEEDGANIVVTGAMRAVEEALGDLKLYRVPERVTVAAKSLKQIAFLDQDRVEGRLLYRVGCSPWGASGFYEDEDEDEFEVEPADMLLVTVNDREHGLGMALPMGGITVFEPSSFGDQLVAEERLRDYAEGQDVEIALGESNQVFAACLIPEEADLDDEPARWAPLRMVLTNANPRPVSVRLVLGNPREWQFRGLSDTRLKDGQRIVEVTVPGNGRREVTWQVRQADGV